MGQRLQPKRFNRVLIVRCDEDEMRQLDIQLAELPDDAHELTALIHRFVDAVDSAPDNLGLEAISSQPLRDGQGRLKLVILGLVAPVPARTQRDASGGRLTTQRCASIRRSK